MHTPIKITVWNANGLSQHGQELTAFIQNNDIDIALISETHFTTRSFIKIPRYSIYHTQHPDGTAHGGTAIIIKTTLKHFQLENFAENYLQATSIKVETCNGPLTFSAVYCPPRHTIKENQFLNFFKTLGTRFVSGGDYNAKHQEWGSRLANPRGRELLKTINKNNCGYLSTGQPTYWPTDRNKLPDLIDFCVIKGISKYYLHAQTCLDLSSDHSPIIVTVHSKALQKQSQAHLHNNRTDWENFRSQVEENMETNLPLKTERDLIEAVEHFNNTIHNAAWNSTPVLENVDRSQCPETIRRAIAEKRKLRRTWHNTRHPSDKNRLNRAERSLKTLLQNHKNQAVQDFLKNLTPTEATEYSLWKATKKLKKTLTPVPPIRKENGNWARSDQEKVETFAEHLAKVFQPFPAEDLQTEEKIIKALEAPFQLDFPIKLFKIKEVSTIIKKINCKKAPGYDLITGKILQQLPEKGIRMITQLCNTVIRLQIVPSQWKVAQIILIHKAGKPLEETASYRPISLLPLLSKIFERLLLKRLHPHLMKEKVIPEHQFGFRKQHATVEQVHRVVNIINQNLEEKRYCTVAFLDISQAFDKVWHPGLLYKIKTKISHSYYTILQSYLSDRIFQVKLQDELSKFHLIQSGVPQGSVMGPILYLLYTSDVPTTKKTTVGTYADDTAVMASHCDPAIASEYLQDHLLKIQDWLKTWRIRANESKSTQVTYTMKRGTCPPVKLNGQTLPQADVARYLGMHLDRRLTWKQHIWMKRKQLGMTYRKMHWLIGPKSQLTLENKVLLYKTILKPIWSYGIQLWGTASTSNIEILQRFQSKTLRSITNAPWYVPNDLIHKDLEVNMVKSEIAKFSEKYQDRLRVHPNRLAMQLLEDGNQIRRLKRYKPLDLIERFESSTM